MYDRLDESSMDNNDWSKTKSIDYTYIKQQLSYLMLS